jgi:hypothetical protein
VDCLLQVFRDAAHVERDQDSPTHWVLVEQRRFNSYFVAFYVLLDHANYLNEKILGTAFPRGFHLLVDAAGGGKNNFLDAEAFAEFAQAYLGYASNVGLALDDRGHFSKRRRFVGIQRYWLSHVHVER